MANKEGLIKDLKHKRDTSTQWLESNYVTPKWGYYDNLYLAVREPIQGAAPWRSNVYWPLIPQIIMDTLPKLVQGLIGDGSGFYHMFPRKIDENYEKRQQAAYAFEQLMQVTFEVGGFRRAVEDASNFALRRGIGWIKCTYKYVKTEREYFDIRKGKVVKVKSIAADIDNPVYTAPDPSNISWNPSAKHISDIRYIVERDSLTRSDIIALLDQEAYDSKEVKKCIEALGLDDEDKKNDMDSRYDVHNIYTASNVYTLIGDFLVRDIPSPYKNRRGIPFFPVRFWVEPQKIVSRGICELLADSQEALNDIVNLTLDNVLISTNKLFVVKEDALISDSNMDIQPGGLLTVTNLNDFRVEDMGQVSSSAFNAISTLMGMANRTVGTIPSLTTAEDGQPVNNKTATAARLVDASVKTRFSLIVDSNIDTCIKPLVKWTIDMLQQYMTTDRATELLGEQVMKDLEIEKADIDLSAEYDFTITGEDGQVGYKSELQNIMTGLEILSKLGDTAISRVDMNAVVDKISKALKLPKDMIIKSTVPAEEKKVSTFDPDKLSPEAKAQLTQLAQVLGQPVEAIIAAIKSGKVTIDQLVQMAQQKEAGAQAAAQPAPAPEPAATTAPVSQ